MTVRPLARTEAVHVFSVQPAPSGRRMPTGVNVDADGNDASWTGISLKVLAKQVLSAARRSFAAVEAGVVLAQSGDVCARIIRGYRRDSSDYKAACTAAKYFSVAKDSVVGKKADLNHDRVIKRGKLANVWKGSNAVFDRGYDGLAEEILDVAQLRVVQLGDGDEQARDRGARKLSEAFRMACLGARHLAAATGVSGHVPATMGALPEGLLAKLRACMYGDGVAGLAARQADAPWQRKMALHHDDMLRIKQECVFVRRLAEARRACTKRCRDRALATGRQQVRIANADDPAMLHAMSDLVAFREACAPGTHYWLRGSMLGRGGLSDEQFTAAMRYRIGASEADHVVPVGVSINCACVQRGTMARGTVHIGGVSGVAHHLARCRCGKGCTIRSHNDVRDVLHAAVRSAGLQSVVEPSSWQDGEARFGSQPGSSEAARKRPDLRVHVDFETTRLVDVQITSAVSKTYVTQGLHSMDAFLERRENDKKGEYKKSSATRNNMSSIVPFVVTTTGRMGPEAFAFLKKVADTAFGDQPRERARWAFRWLSKLNEVIAKGLATQLIWQTQYLRQQVERLR